MEQGPNALPAEEDTGFASYFLYSPLKMADHGMSWDRGRMR